MSRVLYSTNLVLLNSSVFMILSFDTLSTQNKDCCFILCCFRVDIRGELLLSFDAFKNDEI